VGLYEKLFSYRYFLVFYGYTFKEKILRLKTLIHLQHLSLKVSHLLQH